MLVTVLLVWALLGTLVLAIAVASDARLRGASPSLWFILTALFSVFGALAYLVLRPEYAADEQIEVASGPIEEPVSIPTASGQTFSLGWQHGGAVPSPSAYQEDLQSHDETRGRRAPSGKTWLFVGALVILGLVVASAIAAYLASPSTPSQTTRVPTPTVLATLAPTQPPEAPLLAPTPTPEPEDTPEPSPTPTSSEVIYTVREGDTLGSIADQFGVSVQELQDANGLSGEIIQEGQQLRIPERSP